MHKLMLPDLSPRMFALFLNLYQFILWLLPTKFCYPPMPELAVMLAYATATFCYFSLLGMVVSSFLMPSYCFGSAA